MDDRKLAQQAMYLRNAAPEQYAQFVQEFASLATSAALTMLASKPENIMSDQGWAKAWQYILRTLKDCDSRVPPQKPTAEATPR